MERHLESMGNIKNELQLSYFVFNDPVDDYVEGLDSQNLQLVINHEEKSAYDHEGDTIFLLYQERVIIHHVKYLFTNLLKSLVKVYLVLFTSTKIGFSSRFELFLVLNVPVVI